MADDSRQVDNPLSAGRRQFLKLFAATGAVFVFPRHLLLSATQHAPVQAITRHLQSPPADALRVMTYNVWGVPTSTHRAERMIAIGRQLAAMNLDIVGLQECWLEADRERILEGIKGSELRYWHFYPAGFLGSGLMVLSRFPIVDVDFHRYSLNGLPLTIPEVDYYGGKGIAYACIDTPAGEVAFFNTHIVARYTDDEHDIFRAHRAAQAYEFARFVNTHADQRPVIALGDFNVRADNIGYRLITTLAGLSNVYELADESDSEFTGYIDHIFVRNNEAIRLMPIKARLALEQPSEHPDLDRLSDHNAVLTVLAPTKPMTETEPGAGSVTEVLQALLAILEQGITDAIARSRGEYAKAGLSLAAFIGAEVASEKMGDRVFWRRALHYMGTLLALPAGIAQAWLGGISAPDEINALSRLAQEVRLQLERE